MSDLARRSYRWALLGAPILLGVLALDSLHHTFRSQTRLREMLAAPATAALVRLRARPDPGRQPTAREALTFLSERLPDAGVDALDLTQVVLVGDGGAADARRPPSVPEIERLLAGEIVTVGPTASVPAQLLTFAFVNAKPTPFVLRVATPAGVFVQEVGEQRRMALAQGLAFALVLVATALAFIPGRARRGANVPFGAFEEALTRLRAQGEALSSAHEAERHRWESILRDREAMARAGELTAGIVHEVRNGLGTISGYAQLIERGGESADVGASAGGIRSECETLEGVIRRFIELIREEQIRPAPFDIKRLLTRVAGREGHRHPGVAIGVDCASEDCRALGDEEVLERAFENLIRNALEAAGAGGRVWITSARDTQGQWQVTIADDGPGMPAEQRDDIRPFRSTKSRGLGLGLPIAIKLVQLHEGRVVLSSRAGGGTVCAVHLPGDRGTGA